MQQLRYADEIKSFAEVERGDAAPSDQELALAIRLIEQIARDEFHPEAYEDSVKKRIEEVIARKVDGQEVTYAEVEAPQARIIDLMEALKASLEAGGARAGRVGPKRATPKPARRAKARSR